MSLTIAIDAGARRPLDQDFDHAAIRPRTCGAKLLLNVANQTSYSWSYGPATISTISGEFIATGISWAAIAASLPEFDPGYSFLTGGGYALASGLTLRLRSLGAHEAGTGPPSDRGDDRPEPPEFVLAA